MDSLPFNLFDALVIGIVLLSGLLALVRGFVREVLSIVAWIGAALAVMNGLPLLLPYVRDQFGKSIVVDVGTGIAIFLVALVLLSLLFGAVARAVRGSDLGTLDRSLGFLFGLARGAVVVALFYIVGALLVPVPEHPETVQTARTLPVVRYVARLVATVAPPQVAEALDALPAGQPPLRAGAPPGRSPDSGGETGYKSEDRQGLDRLIGNTQER